MSDAEDPAVVPAEAAVGRPDLTPSARTRRQWRDRRRGRRLAAAGRLGVPVAVVAVLEAILVSSHRNLADRVTMSLRPALLLLAVVLPLGGTAAVVITARIRSRDRLRPLAPGERYIGLSALQAGPGAVLTGSDRSARWLARRQWAVGELRLFDDRETGAVRLQWQPTESSRSRGYRPLQMAAINLARTELELDRPRYGYVRIGVGPERHVDFGVMDVPRLVVALTGTALRR